MKKPEYVFCYLRARGNNYDADYYLRFESQDDCNLYIDFNMQGLNSMDQINSCDNPRIKKTRWQESSFNAMVAAGNSDLDGYNEITIDYTWALIKDA